MQPPPENLTRDFFARSVEAVARDLLGFQLTRTLDDGTILSGIITETEAYVGPEDRASHAFGGRRTARNEHMWSQPGTAYVYFTYGMHHCFNIACLREGHPAAVLIRAMVPTEGIETMRTLRSARPRKHPLRDKDLCNGPGKLCQALAIDLDLDGIDLLQSPHLAITQGVAVPEARIQRTPRIGIGSAGDWVQKPLRWVTRMDPT
ncbi:MAG TPA: DNA-3-methyladenine glycosylase [Phycisphaerales bacterium]|nr:DNA-3-methyladenine glycosylase [Phycisphaerales bacterium]